MHHGDWRLLPLRPCLKNTRGGFYVMSFNKFDSSVQTMLTKRYGLLSVCYVLLQETVWFLTFCIDIDVRIFTAAATAP